MVLLCFLQMLQVKAELLRRAKVVNSNGSAPRKLSPEKQRKVANAMAAKQFRGAGQHMEFAVFHEFFMTTIIGRPPRVYGIQ